MADTTASSTGGVLDDLQSIFTGGLSKLVDAEIDTNVSVNPSNASYGTTANGTTVPAGQPNAAAATSVPGWAWIAGGVAALVAVILVLRR